MRTNSLHRAFLAALTTALLLVWGPGCVECLTVGCTDPFIVTMDHSSGEAPADGSYTLTLTETGNDPVVCHLVYSAGKGGNVYGPCSAGGGIVSFLNLAPKGVVTLDFADANDATILATDTLTVSYKTTSPAGTGCGDCFNTSVSLDVAQ